VKVLALLALLLAAGPSGGADEVLTRRVGRLTIRVETGHAYPGGLFVVRFESRVRLGALSAVFEGRRAPAFDGPDGLTALVPIPFDTPPGSWTMGVEVRSRRGAQHTTLRVPVVGRNYPTRVHELPPAAVARVETDEARRDGRRLLLAVRELTPRSLRNGPFRPPVAAAAGDSFGSHEDSGGVPVERTRDGTWGERQRALEFPVAPGTAVGAPAGGTVLLSESLALTGGTLVIDHGEGLVSALYPLGRLAVREGDAVAAGQLVGSTGNDPLGEEPRLEWALYLHGIAVDPRVVMALDRPGGPAPSAGR